MEIKMQIWQLQEAKAKLTKLLNEAKQEPQFISRHGINESVVMSLEKYQELIGEKKDLVAFFKKSPLKGIDLDIKRDASFMRDSEL